MKLTRILIVAAFGAAASQVAMAYDGTVTFNGKVNDVTCSIDAGGAGSANSTVTLPQISKSSLLAEGSVAGSKAFTFVIGGKGEEGCTDGKVASVNFESGANVDLTTGMLRNTGTAKNVQVVLMNDDGTEIKVGNADDNNHTSAAIKDNTATLSYIAAYKANGGAAVEGTVAASVNYTVTYN